MAARFAFRFEPLLRLRISQRDQAQGQLADALQALRILEQQRDDIEQQRLDILQQARGQLIASRPIAVDALLLRGRYEMQLAADLKETVENHGKVLAEVEHRRQRLTEADAEVRRLERLEQQQRQQWHRQQLAAEQAEIDAQSLSRFAQRLRQSTE